MDVMPGPPLQKSLETKGSISPQQAAPRRTERPSTELSGRLTAQTALTRARLGLEPRASLPLGQAYF